MVGSTVDEPVYRVDGQRMLESAVYTEPRDKVHPPFAKQWGALGAKLARVPPPEIITDRAALAFRVPHVALYAAVGALSVFFLWFSSGPWPAAFFSLFYGLSINLKAFASLHVTDSDSAVLALGAFVSAWSARAPAFRTSAWMAWILAGLLGGLAVSAKLSVGVLLVVLLGLVATSSESAASVEPRSRLLSRMNWIALAWVGTGVVLGVVAAFQFRWEQVSTIFTAAIRLAEYLGQPHDSYLLGYYSSSGFRSYYLWLLLFKLPPAFWCALLLGFAVALTSRRTASTSFGNVLKFWFLPAGVLLVLASSGSLQIGVRHLLPAILLLEVGTAIFLSGMREKLRPVVLSILALGFVASDSWALTRDSYLSYANILTPHPSTRAFCDSNNDWGQQLPAHLYGGRSEMVSFDRPGVLALASQGRFPITLVEGATRICGFWSRRAPALKMFEPADVVAGHEVHVLDAQRLFEAYRVMADQRYSSLLDGAKMRELLPVPRCPAERRRVRFMELFPEGQRQLRARVRVPVVEGREYLAIVEPADFAGVAIRTGVGVNKRKKSKYLFVSGVQAFEPVSSEIEVTLSFLENRGYRPMMALAWEECSTEP